MSQSQGAQQVLFGLLLSHFAPGEKITSEKKATLGGLFRRGGDLHHFCDSLAHVFNVIAVERGDTHATGIGAVHTELFAQANHLVF